jgi:NAD(P)-dependent dehydrogenase (short-subunit alcohol dehydrogenase family)
MIHEFGTRMQEHGRGAIVNIGSTVSVRGLAPRPAVRRRARLHAHRARGQPGRLEGRPRDQLTRDTPAGRIPEPDELAGTALFLASDEAAHITA